MRVYAFHLIIILLLGVYIFQPQIVLGLDGKSRQILIRLEEDEKSLKEKIIDTVLENAVMISANNSFTTCALSKSGGVKCWGFNYFGQLGDGTTINRTTPVDVVGLASDVTSISVNYSHSCVLTSSGGVKCWGDNSYGQLGDGTTTNSTSPVNVVGLKSGVAAISTGYRYTCALIESGGMKCWGSNGSGQLGDGTTNNRTTPVDVIGLTSGVAAISAGSFSNCALTSSGGVKCWGNNDFGQLGDGTTISRLIPVNVIDLAKGVAAISAGYRHTCALTSFGGVKCWGSNGFGELGNVTEADSTIPIDVTGLASGVAVISASGRYHTCALTSSGGVKCWGLNSDGQLGDGTNTLSNNPVDVVGMSSGVFAISVGAYHTCALANSGLKCWGNNQGGQLGIGWENIRTMPVDVIGLASGMTTIGTGSEHNCVLTSTTGMKCWGQNLSYQLGDGTTTYRLTPVDVIGLENGVTAIGAGEYHTCALTDSGVRCWGDNRFGQLGDGSLTSGVAGISLGSAHTCALTSSGGMKCWGLNSDGQLGDGTNTLSNSPVDVVGMSSGVFAISVGAYHTCALANSSGVKCWGYNSSSQVGDGTTTNRATPVDVDGLTSGVKAISAGRYHTCALTNSGGVKCWGDNSFGQVGDGTMINRATPVDVVGLPSGVLAISAGGFHTCALTNSGVKCWGGNSYGELGDGTTTSSSIPVDVVGLTSGVIKVSAGGYHTCIITNNGGVKCWGWNDYGQLGNGEASFSLLPMNVVGFDGGGTGDLTIGSVIPVQVVEGADLIKDKATAVRVVVNKTGSMPINNVQVRLSYERNIYFSFYVAESGNMDPNTHALVNNQSVYPLNFPAGDSSKSIYFFGSELTPTNTSFQASVTVDPGNVIAETDEANNNGISTAMVVRDTTWSGSLWPDFYPHYFRTDWGNAPFSNYNLFYQYSNWFVKNVFPIPSQRYSPNSSNSFIGDTSTYVGDDGRLSAYELGQWVEDTITLMWQSNPTADRFISVVPSGWFLVNTTQNFSTTVGLMSPDMPDLVISEARTPSRTNGASVVAHEFGHSYGLALGCEEYEDCNTSRMDDIGNYASRGLFVNERIPIQLPTPRNTYCFMGAYDDGAEYWIDWQDYNSLLTSHPVSIPTPNIQSVSSGAILAVGTINENDLVFLENWYVLPDADVEAIPSGPYTFRYLDNLNNILFEQSFDISFELDMGNANITIDETPFVIRIPNVQNVTKIQIMKETSQLAEKVVSPNAPAVNVISPNGGESYSDKIHIHWSGNDLDGDSLTYSVLISADNGMNWEPVVGNLSITNMEIQVQNFSTGSQYLVKITATDGFNTSNDVSDKVFTIQKGIFLPLVTR
jgi:alpha-tubulin suppressor-like RCC1 family protein